jgi:hypothetical protein
LVVVLAFGLTCPGVGRPRAELRLVPGRRRLRQAQPGDGRPRVELVGEAVLADGR